MLLTAAYRSLSRPSSAPSAKASALCPLLLNQLAYTSVMYRSFSIVFHSCENSTGFFSYNRLSKSLPILSLTEKLISSIFVVFCFSSTFDTLFSFQGAFNVFLMKDSGGLGRTRTSDLTLIRRALEPPELQAHKLIVQKSVSLERR